MKLSSYYEQDGITIYHGRFEDVLPALTFDAVVTDPPYPATPTGRCDFVEAYNYHDAILKPFETMTCPQAIFWTPSVPFPLSWDGQFIWDKAVGTGTQFEPVFFRGVRSGHKVERFYHINSTVAASYTGDTFNEHPSQKPVKLMRRIVAAIGDSPIIFDPFMGSGTTLLACKLDGRRAIGCEITERYCEIAANRLRQGVLPFAG